MKLAMPRTAVLSATVFAALVASSGCTVQTVHPLRDSGKVVLDDRVLGDWQEWDPDFGASNECVSISRDGWGRYRVRGTNENDERGEVDMVGCLVEFGGDRYFELREPYEVSNLNSAVSTKVSSYLFARMKIEGDKLIVSLPNQDTFKKAISSGDLTGVVEHHGFLVTRIVLTSSANELRDFIALNPESTFRESVEFRRVNREAGQNE